MDFCENFKKLRTRIGTQEYAADLLKISMCSVSQFERGYRTPPPHKQRLFLKILGDKVLDIAQSEIMRKRQLEGII